MNEGKNQDRHKPDCESGIVKRLFLDESGKVNSKVALRIGLVAMSVLVAIAAMDGIKRGITNTGFIPYKEVLTSLGINPNDFATGVEETKKVDALEVLEKAFDSSDLSFVELVAAVDNFLVNGDSEEIKKLKGRFDHEIEDQEKIKRINTLKDRIFEVLERELSLDFERGKVLPGDLREAERVLNDIDRGQDKSFLAEYQRHLKGGSAFELFRKGLLKDLWKSLQVEDYEVARRALVKFKNLVKRIDVVIKTRAYVDKEYVHPLPESLEEIDRWRTYDIVRSAFNANNPFHPWIDFARAIEELGIKESDFYCAATKLDIINGYRETDSGFGTVCSGKFVQVQEKEVKF